jgi:GSH-dependent disulfide-bond oxidoreductase
VLSKRIKEREFIAGEYSLLHMDCYPWIVPYPKHGQTRGVFPHLERWFETVRRACDA